MLATRRLAVRLALLFGASAAVLALGGPTLLGRLVPAPARDAEGLGRAAAALGLATVRS